MPPRKTTATKKTTTRKTTVRRATKKVTTEPTAVTTPHHPVKKVHRTYTFAVGRRKQAVARVRMYPTGQGEITINARPLAEYFRGFELQHTVVGPLQVTQQEQHGAYTVKVAGGGIQGQAEAVRLGIARVLVKHDADVRIPLKRAGFLSRDPRVKERKKYGLKRARRAPQWQKR